MPQRKTDTTRKSGASGKTTRKGGRQTKSRAPRIAGLELELPDSLRDFGRQVRRRVTQLEKEAARLREDASRRATRLVREASHRLGWLEAEGEAGWRELTDRSRRDLANLLRRLERAVDPGPRRSTSGSRRGSGAERRSRGGGRSGGASGSRRGSSRSAPGTEPGAPPGPGSSPAAPPGRAPTDTSAPPS